MSFETVARKYAVDTHRTRAAWVATALFVVVFGFIGWNAGWGYDGRVGAFTTGGVQTAAGVLVPLVTVALGHGAVAGDRESGALRVLLAYPHSRRDVIAGAFLGRLLAVLLAVVAGLLAAAFAYTVRAGQLPEEEALTLAAFVLLWTLFGVSLAVAVSTLTSTGRRAVAGGLGAYVGFMFIWDWVPREAVNRIYPREQRYPAPEWAQVWTNLDPISGFMDATNLLRFTPNDPLAVYETLPFYAALLVVWTVIPMALALWRFPKADL